MLYHYLGGIALAMTNHYEEAAEYFEACVSVPSGGGVSALQIEAARKLYLAQLIWKGKISPLPKYTNPTVTRMIKSSVYSSLANHYPLNTKGLANILVKERSTFVADQTLGLVLIALSHAPRWSIVRLTQTYISLHLGDIISERGVKHIDPKGGATSIVPPTSTSASAQATGSSQQQAQQSNGTITPQAEGSGSQVSQPQPSANEEEAGVSLIRKFTKEEIREMILDMVKYSHFLNVSRCLLGLLSRFLVVKSMRNSLHRIPRSSRSPQPQRATIGAYPNYHQKSSNSLFRKLRSKLTS
jgi:hypothetical protein